MAGYDFRVKVECETLAAVVCDVFTGEIHGDLNRNGYRIVNEHEALQDFMTLLVGRGRRENEFCNKGGVVLFPGDGRRKVRREL